MTDAPNPATSRKAGARGPSWPAVLVYVLIAAVVAAGAAAFVVADREGTPGSDSVEAGFLRDMTTHHDQAVLMAMTTYRLTQDEAVRNFSYDLGTTQQSQVGMMRQTLTMWDLPQASTAQQMAWMGHEMAPGERMPGMASDAQLAELSTLPGPQADVRFLQLMIVHHRGGVEMAQALLDRSDNEQVRLLANIFLRAQTAEIETMNNMLIERGAAPVEGMAVPDTVGGTPVATPVSTPGHEGHGG